ncbi:SDR family oxidoreductase [Candidatus Nephthysia bennettiae]|uniref:SDR family oxidoreductase n=1 Tax=Candidatus Nephthysia bennettiae TaxID=3127016 RepID=A0A934K474_9BACT|nr:SDR family oxidoreductase [Candidatus Dormibacteraeota bacterium]MBJ7614373.1 SDR family oxidoreductase [Candidatus Dormibacteraeota bacterium]
MSENQMPPQHQPRQPGSESMMNPQPDAGAGYRAAGKLEGRVGLVTGGDSGIGRAVAVLFAKEGADVAIVYLDEHEDAQETKSLVEAEGRRCVTIAGDVGDESFCRQAVERTVSELGKLDVLVNNAAEQHAAGGIEEISEEHLERTFRTNIFGYFHMTKAAVPYLGPGSAIVNTSSITAFQGNPMLIDYSSTKGAIVSFTRALSNSLVEKGIRVNGVAPGPIWTPLIPATFPEERVETFGQDTPMKRPGQPHEVATCFVFLASDDASYISGQFLHPNGGQVVGG